jgi:L-fuconolactonase
MQIERLSQSSKLKGLRPMLQDLPDPDWILQPQIQPILQYMAAHDLVFDALIKPHHLPNILKLVHQHPQLRVVIDHGAKPRIEAKQRSEWQLQMKQLAHQSDPQRVACKLSGLWTEAKPGSECEVVRPWCEDLIAIWGDTRLMWGSDWPVLELAGSYATWRNLTLDILKSHTPESQRKILALNALQMYGL